MKKEDYILKLNDIFLGTIDAYEHKYEYSLPHGDFIHKFFDENGLIFCILRDNITVKQI